MHSTAGDESRTVRAIVENPRRATDRHHEQNILPSGGGLDGQDASPTSDKHPTAPSQVVVLSSQSQDYLPGWLEATVSSPGNPRQSASPINISSAAMDGAVRPSISGVLNLLHLPEVPTWFVDEDFDLAALSSCIMTNSFVSFTSGHETNNNTAKTPVPQHIDHKTHIKEEQSRRAWFTYVWTGTDEHIASSSVPEHSDIGEQYRLQLSQKLQQRIPSDPLPSTDYLVSTVTLVLHPGSWACRDIRF